MARNPAILRDFVRESNRIEGIHREPTNDELSAHITTLDAEAITLWDVSRFVGVIQPGAVLRDRSGLDVRVGSHYPPRGGPEIAAELSSLLAADGLTSFDFHRRYESLHPYTDGNGRSGRALWLRTMDRRGQLGLAQKFGFLHCWYYQSLEDTNEKR